MSQMLASEAEANQVLHHDLYFVKKRAIFKSTVTEANCTICDKGLGEGVSVTAKKIGQKMRLFCQYHLPKDV